MTIHRIDFAMDLLGPLKQVCGAVARFTPRDVTEGFRILNDMLQAAPDTKVIVITGRDGQEHALQAIGQGAYDFQLQPLNLAKVGAVLEKGLSYQQLVGEVSDLQRRLDERYRFDGITRRSSPWQRIYGQIEQVAQSRSCREPISAG